MAKPQRSSQIDVLMDRASMALVATDYFGSESACLRAMEAAHRAHDFERMARICLPLQEARRQRRQLACDVSGCRVLTRLPRDESEITPGRYLLMPGLVGIDARNLRDLAHRARMPVMVLVREPTTRAGKVPMVGVGTGPREPVVVRSYCEPYEGESPSLEWFNAAHEQLGDEAIAKAPKGVPADHHVDDLLDLLEAVPDHEKLIQALAAACRAACGVPISVLPRRRPLREDALSF